MKKKRAKPKRYTALSSASFEVITLILGVITATSSDAKTRLMCDEALGELRRQRRLGWL